MSLGSNGSEMVRLSDQRVEWVPIRLVRRGNQEKQYSEEVVESSKSKQA
jgi:hypothetical protein